MKNQLDKNGNKTGYWEHYYLNGNISSKGNFDNDKRVGYWEYYYFDGQLQCKGNYDLNGNRVGVRVGYWEDYYFDGKICYKKYFI